MTILIDIGHPAHVHLFRNFIKIMKGKGYDFIITVKDKNPARQLLDLYGISYITLPPRGSSITGKFFKQLLFDFLVIRLIRKNNIRVGIGSSITIAHASLFTRMYSIIFDDDDDEVQPLFARFAHPYADMLVSPESLRGHRKRVDTVYYPSYHVLAYLHPDVFSPDCGVVSRLGLSAGDKYFILRFTAFKAHHDINESGITLEQKRELIALLEGYGKVFISSESEIEDEFRDKKLEISPVDIHSVIACAWMYIGESQTMTSEAAILGTPALRCNTFSGRMACLDEEEKKYFLTYSFLPDNFDSMIEKIKELMAIEDLKEEWKKRREKMLNEKASATSFMVDIVERVIAERSQN